MARRIKRYENRKLYDTEASAYVSLGDIADLVREGETVEVIDNATGRDLTAQTLTQIILEEGKNGDHVIPSDILHDLLRRSEAALDSGLDQLRTTVDDLVQSSFGQLKRLVQSPRARELDELRGQLRDLESKLATLLDGLDDAHRPSSAAPNEAATNEADATGSDATGSDATGSDAPSAGVPNRD